MTSTVTLISMGRYVIDVRAPDRATCSSLRGWCPDPPGEIGPREALPSIAYLTVGPGWCRRRP